MPRRPSTPNGGTAEPPGETLYDRAALGFRNYWYPACLSKEVTVKKPRPMKLLGDEVVFYRRNAKAYALADECPHRGTRLSRGRYEFPGTNTITCRYHAWTFDVTNGMCVAALSDGPDSPIVGKAKVRTYPVEERRGIVWIWMGRMAPVPLEEDVPKLLLREGSVVQVMRRTPYGNWRWHAENGGWGHNSLHRDSVRNILTQVEAYTYGFNPFVGEAGEDGEWLHDPVDGFVPYEDYPGLGRYPKPRPWRHAMKVAPENQFGIPSYGILMRLPGLLQSPVDFPIKGAQYYEWYVPVDEDHYMYFQVCVAWPKGPLGWLSYLFRFYLWGRPAGMYRLNGQDMSVVGDSTDFDKRHGSNLPSKVYRPDIHQLAWRNLCNRTARGEAVEVPEEESAAKPVEVA